MKRIILLIVLMMSYMGVFSQTFEEMLKKAEKQDAAAQCAVGLSYLKGLNVKKNEAKAVQWFQHSASLGYAFGQYNLAQCFCAGIGVSQNFELGAIWATKAAKQGFVDAQFLLGRLYLNGYGVEKNGYEAFKWFLRAAEQGNPLAQHMTAYCYNEGIGVAKNPVEEIKWLSKAGENGDITSQMIMAQNAENNDDAFKWYMMAAKLGNADAQYVIGTFYRDGKATLQDYNKAISWFEKAIEQEHIWAYNDL
ncbi:MAG: sel1 repeat family protein, partial [Bacteroides sp.]|nr:sel1 repeat family protein [Bacteroides sp.]